MPRGGRLFTNRTRYYLRRRAWRFFRWLGYARPAEYPAAIAPALQHYRDEDLEKGENILDSWALLNICFRGSDGACLQAQPTCGLAEGPLARGTGKPHRALPRHGKHRRQRAYCTV